MELDEDYIKDNINLFDGDDYVTHYGNTTEINPIDMSLNEIVKAVYLLGYKDGAKQMNYRCKIKVPSDRYPAIIAT